MLDILQTNRMPVLEALASLQTQLQSLQLALEAGDESRLREALERAWRARVAWAVGKREPR
jgi:prephenate dehydrogenase